MSSNNSIVFDSLISTLKKIEELGTDYAPPSDISHFYSLTISMEPAGPSGEDVEMEDVQQGSETAAGTTANGEAAPQAEDSQSKSHDNLIINYIDAFGRVLYFLLPYASRAV